MKKEGKVTAEQGQEEIKKASMCLVVSGSLLLIIVICLTAVLFLANVPGTMSWIWRISCRWRRLAAVFPQLPWRPAIYPGGDRAASGGSLSAGGGHGIGLVFLGACHDGVENPSGICSVLLKGDITRMEVNAIPPGVYGEPVCVLTLPGREIRELLEKGFVVNSAVEGFPYIPSGINFTKTAEGTVETITWEEGSAFDENGVYTAAVDQDGYIKEVGQRGAVKETELTVMDVIGEYLRANSPVTPLEHSVR